MSLFKFLWLRRFIRKNTSPIPRDRAAFWKRNLSFFYMIASWNAFGIVCYMCYIGKSDWALYHGLKSEEEAKMTPAQSWAKTFQLNKVQVYRYKGFKKTGEYMLEDGEIVKPEPEATV